MGDAMTENNGHARPPAPPPLAPPLTPPRIDSLYNLITRRIRSANTIFGDNVKLVLRQLEDEQWAKLPLPYLLVVPTQTRPTTQRKDTDSEVDSIVSPRTVALIAQLDGRGSEAEHLAAIDIETAEKQLIYILVNWRPLQHYK